MKYTFLQPTLIFRLTIKILLLFLVIVSDVSISTWNDLRVESVFALLSGFVGLVGVILTLKPFSLKINRRITLILAICGMVISCELSINLSR